MMLFVVDFVREIWAALPGIMMLAFLVKSRTWLAAFLRAIHVAAYSSIFTNFIRKDYWLNVMAA